MTRNPSGEEMKSQVEVEQGDKGLRIADEKIRQRPVTSRASLS